MRKKKKKRNKDNIALALQVAERERAGDATPCRGRVIWESSVLENCRREVAALEMVQKMRDLSCLGLTQSPQGQGGARKDV